MGQGVDFPPHLSHTSIIPNKEVSLLTQTPNSPQELVELNNNPVPTPEMKFTPESIMNWLMDESNLTPKDMIELSKRMNHLLLNFHRNVMDEKLKEGEDIQAIQFWVEDTQKLETICYLQKDL